MLDSFRKVLDPRNLVASYSQREGMRATPLTDYWMANPEQVETNEYELVYFPEENRPAPGNVPGGEANVIDTQGATTKKGTLFRSFNVADMGADGINALREPESHALQQKGERVVERAFSQFTTRHDLFREAVIASILCFGRVNLNSKYEVVRPTVNAGTGALTDHADTMVSADFQISDSHRGDLNDIISAQWSVANTNILDHLDEIDDAAEAEGLPKPMHIWLHPLNKIHLRANTQFQTWAVRNNVAIDTILRGEFIEGFGGKTWHFLGSKYQAPGDTGNSTDFIPNTLAVMTPDPGPWVKPSEGSELIPTEIGIQTDVMEALRNLAKVYGRFAYAALDHNPAKLQMYMGENFGLNFAEPNAMWIGKVFTQS